MLLKKAFIKNTSSNTSNKSYTEEDDPELKYIYNSSFYDNYTDTETEKNNLDLFADIALS